MNARFYPVLAAVAAVSAVGATGCASGKAAPRPTVTFCDPGGPACPDGQGCMPATDGPFCAAEKGPPVVSDLAALRTADGHVHLGFAASDPDADAVAASAAFLDAGDAVLGTVALPVGSVHGLESFAFAGDVGDSPAAKVRVTVTDTGGGNGSATSPVTVSSGGAGDPCVPGTPVCTSGLGCLPGAGGSTCGTETGPPQVTAAQAIRTGDGHVHLSFTASDPDSDAITASAALLNASGGVLATTALAIGSVHGKASFSYSGDLGVNAAATKVRVTVTDTAGGTGSAEATITAATGSPGSPCVATASTCNAGLGCLPGASGSTCGTETGAPAVSAVQAVRGGDGHVALSFTASDPDKDFLSATSAFLDGGGAVIGTPSVLAIGSAYGQASFPFAGDVGVSAAAVKVRVTVKDTGGGTGTGEATITTSGGTGTTVAAGNVSGHWTLAGSPYLVQGNITVAKGTTLTIDPGVQVQFQGQYWFRLYGGVHWVGTSASHIVFTTQPSDRIAAEGGSKTESTWVGWRGVRIAADISGNGIDHGAGLYDVEYCEFNYVDKGGQVGADPYENDVGNFFANGYDATDLVFDYVELHHGRTSLIRLSPHLNAPAGAHTHQGIVGTHHVPKTANGFAAFDIGHVHNGSGGAATMTFVGGSISSSSILSSSPLAAIVDASDAIVELKPASGASGAFPINGCTQESCANRNGWFSRFFTGDSVLWNGVTWP